MTPTEPIDPESVREYVSKVLASLGRSEISRRLLQYLVERALRGEVPKEMDIAVDVFHRDASFTGDDAVVRVNVRSLRQRLDEYYRNEGKADPFRLEIPKGGYKLGISRHPLQSGPPAGPEAAAAEPNSAAPHRANLSHAAVLLIALALATASAAATYVLTRASDSSAAERRTGAANDPLWKSVNESKRPLTIVLGDLLLYSQYDEVTQRSQLIRNSRVNSAEELRQLLAERPTNSPTTVTTTFLPISAVLGLGLVLPVVSSPDRQIEIVIPEELKVGDIRTNDIIYIGPMVRLGPIAEYLTQVSRYVYDRKTYQLTDKVSRLPFPAHRNQDGPASSDYGLFATFPGPTGNRIMTLTSSARDVGLLHVARTMTSEEGLKALRSHFDDRSFPENFEVLMAVTGYERTDLKGDIVSAHAINASSVPSTATNP